jgi:peptidyl-prolyl cis-trans isomerase C
MKPVLIRIGAALAACSLAGGALAASPDDVLVRTPEMVITRGDWEAELTRIPNDQRMAFTASSQRVQAALNNVLINRTLAERARAKGLDKDPTMARRLTLETERFLAALMIDRIETDAGEEFDRMRERNLERARELYLVNQAKFVAPEQIDVTHILFDPVKRGKDAALASAVDARAKIVAGADFGALAQASSDDPSGAKNKGRIDGLTRGKTDPAFEQAAFALKKPGDVSEPVLSRFGYHVIRLEDRKPARQKSLVEAQQQIVAEMRQKHIQEAREAVVMAIRSDSRVQVDQEAVDALVLKVDYPALPQPNAAAPAPPKKRAK